MYFAYYLLLVILVSSEPIYYDINGPYNYGMLVLFAGQSLRNETINVPQNAIRTLHNGNGANSIWTAPSGTGFWDSPLLNDKIMNWFSMNQIYGQATLDDIIDIYSDFDNLYYEFQQINSFLIPFGDMIFCEEYRRCVTNLTKIGPTSSRIPESNVSLFYPISMNSDFSINRIIQIKTRYSKSFITINAFFYVVHEFNCTECTQSDIKQLISDSLAPNAGVVNVRMYTIHQTIPAYYGMFSATYLNAKITKKDFSNPQNWSELYSEFYFTHKQKLFFMYGLNAVCSNEQMYSEYMYEIYASESNNDDKLVWIIIGAVVTFLFVAVMIGLYYFIGDRKKRKHGFQQTQTTEI